MTPSDTQPRDAQHTAVPHQGALAPAADVKEPRRTESRPGDGEG